MYVNIKKNIEKKQITNSLTQLQYTTEDVHERGTSWFKLFQTYYENKHITIMKLRRLPV